VEKKKHQQYDFTVLTTVKSYSCRTPDNKTINATDFVVGSPVTFTSNGKNGEIRTQQGKSAKCLITRVADAPAQPAAAVQKRLRDWGSGRRGLTGKTLASPLMGKLFDAAGDSLTPSHALKDGRRYRYYISRALVTGTSQETSGGWRLPAPQIERIVAAEAVNMLADSGELAATLEMVGLAASRLPAAIASAEALRRRLGSELERADALAIFIDRVELKRDTIRTTLALAPLILPVDRPEHLPTGPTLTRETPLRIKRRGVEMRIVIECQEPAPSQVDPILLKEIVRARRSFEALVTGHARSLAELARREGVTDSYVSTRLPLAFLAPGIVEAIVKGTQPADLTAKKLTTRVHLPLDWHAQKRALGFQ
jgi:site-specific DNA recombinase